ncbi:heme peroxidase [Mycena galopus ATCC 62051]|nr:heme peroxidase [Mycena galopus ATCC 62051]
MLSLSLLPLLCVCYVGGAQAYIWPSPQLDRLEDMRFGRNPLLPFIRPCTQFHGGPKTGRANVADWIRTAYHDMATHNIADGTGGMDASIRFAAEQARPEDVGDGFSNTLSDVLDISDRYASIADVLALAAISAIENCGGPQIAFRGGRIDAGVPNSPGVPQPQDTLNSHIASFARQGFTQKEMIGLVACGHTFGGVQHAPFPDIVPQVNDPNNTQSAVHFDSTFVQFDNNVATEYISGTTQNPLVVGLNDTTNSDKRIFGSDGNATMRSFASSPQLFASTCADLFARMLNTVPKGVQLTEVLTPLPVRPDIDLILAGNVLQFSGTVRLWNVTDDPSRIVRLLWNDHLGHTHNATLALEDSGPGQPQWYLFAEDFLALDPAAGVTTMRFNVNGTLEDQGGRGFPVQDDVVFSSSSCFNPDGTGRVDIGVRTSIKPTRVYLQAQTRDSVNRPIVLEIDVPPPSKAAAHNASYAIWSIELKADQVYPMYAVGAEINGVKGTRNDQHPLSFFEPCA